MPCGLFDALPDGRLREHNGHVRALSLDVWFQGVLILTFLVEEAEQDCDGALPAASNQLPLTLYDKDSINEVVVGCAKIDFAAIAERLNADDRPFNEHSAKYVR